MDDFYSWFAAFKESSSFSYGALGEPIQKNGNAMRMAVIRKSLSELEKEKITQVFDVGAQNEKTPPGEVRFEDLVARKSYELLLPVLEDYSKYLK